MPEIIRPCCYILYFNHFNNNIGVATLRGRGAAVKDRDTLIEQSVANSNKQGTQNNSHTE